MRKLLVTATLGLALALVGLSSGCVVRTRPVRASVVAYDYGYTPMLYNGYVVYYDRAAQPYYYVGSTRYWVPRAYWPRYRGYYYRYRTHYWRWYRHRGHYYRGRRYRRGYFRRARYRRRGRRRGHYRRRYY